MEFSFDQKPQCHQRRRVTTKRQSSALKLLRSDSSLKRYLYSNEFTSSIELTNLKFYQNLFCIGEENNNNSSSLSYNSSTLLKEKSNSFIGLYDNNETTTLKTKTLDNRILKRNNLKRKNSITKSLRDLGSNNILTKFLHSSKNHLFGSESLFNSKLFSILTLTMDKKSQNFENFSALATNLATINAMDAEMTGMLGRIRFDVKGKYCLLIIKLQIYFLCYLY